VTRGGNKPVSDPIGDTALRMRFIGERDIGPDITLRAEACDILTRNSSYRQRLLAPRDGTQTGHAPPPCLIRH
jgi:hypothetical protein